MHFDQQFRFRRITNRAAWGYVELPPIDSVSWLEEQLHPDLLDNDALHPHQHAWAYYKHDIPDLIKVESKQIRRILQDRTILSAVYSRWQLYERMVEFWTDHFNISIQKRGSVMPALKLVDDRDVIRTHALGNVRELLHASSQSPAMLLYLDNVQNRKRSPNENYARELLELHTMGVDGGYSHADIDEAARALSGWGWIPPAKEVDAGKLLFRKRVHDDGAKEILGTVFRPKQYQGDRQQLVDLLADHPATGRFLARKLAERFVSDDPSDELINAVARSYQRSNGDIKSMLRTLFMSDELLWSQPKLKRPFDFMVSALRLLEARIADNHQLHACLVQMGQPLFRWPAPDGYPVEETAWVDKLLTRWNVAIDFGRGRVKGVDYDAAVLEKLSAADLTQRFAIDNPSKTLLERLHGLDSISERVALLLASPNFQRC